jgi:hypothetical protein
MKTKVIVQVLASLMGMEVLLVGLPTLALDEEPELAAWWRFEEGQGLLAADSAGKHQDALQGYAAFAPGVRGNGLKFDGFTSRVVRRAAQVPRLTGAFSIEAWIAAQEYSWNWTGIVDHDQDARAGYFFGIDHLGRIGLHASVDGRWQGCLSKEPVPLLKWSHVAGTFDPQQGFAVYVNGKLAGQTAAPGQFKPAENLDLLLGMSHRRQCLCHQELGRCRTEALPGRQGGRSRQVLPPGPCRHADGDGRGGVAPARSPATCNDPVRAETWSGPSPNLRRTLTGPGTHTTRP